jgi:hypothetical protein
LKDANDRAHKQEKSRRHPLSDSSDIFGDTSVEDDKTKKAILYEIMLSIGRVLLCADFNNNSYRRQVDAVIPSSSIFLLNLNGIIDPILGRQKKILITISNGSDESLDDEQIKPVATKFNDRHTTVHQ